MIDIIENIHRGKKDDYLTLMRLVTSLVLVASVAVAYSAPSMKSENIMVLKRIVVIALNPEQESILRQAIPTRIGESLTPEAMNKLKINLTATSLPLDKIRFGIRQYSGQTSFDTDVHGATGSSVSEDVELVFDFRPIPRLTSIEIFPLVQIDKERLKAKCPIHVGEMYDSDSIETARKVLNDEVLKEGIHDAKVSLHRTLLTSSTLALGFVIEGAVPVRLYKRQFKGAGWLNASRIREQLKHLEPIAFDKGSTVTAQMLQDAEYVATDVMHALGYLEAQARLSETDASSKGLRVTYQIDRGPRYRIGESHAEGIRFPDRKFWQNATEPYINKPFTSARFDDIKKAIEHQAGINGYMAPVVALDVVPSIKTHTITINAHVDEGTTSSLGAIRIERREPERGYGTSWYHRRFSPPLSEEIIKKQIRARSGNPMNSMITDNATRRLYRLNTFEDVKVETAATSDTFVRDIVASVREKRTAYAGISLGWNDETGPVSRLTMTEKNVGGQADVLNIGLSIGLNEKALGGEISYLDRYWKSGERWLGEEREPSLLWSAYLNESSYDQYNEKREGGALRLGYQIGKHNGPWSNGWQARLERITYEPFHNMSDYHEKFRDYIAATIAYDLTYDRLERGEWDSMRGFLVNTSIETGAADGLLLDWTTRTDWRRPIIRRWIWQVQSEVGLMPIESTGVGMSHRFQAGGMNGIRGFEYHGLGPVDRKNDELHIGGATKLILQNEIRYIVNENVQIPLFFDIGTLDKEPFTIGTIRASTGVGVRFKIPGMNQRAYLYYAQNILKEETDDNRSIHFGFSFDF